MPTANQRLWDSFRRSLGVTVQPAIRRGLQEKYGTALLEIVAAEMPEYLAGFKDSTGTASCIYTLADMIQRGDWKRQEEPEPQAPSPIQRPAYTLAPIGLTDDALLMEMPPLIQCLAESRLEKTDISPDFAIAGALAQVTAVCGNRLRFHAWGDDRYTNLYLILVGETGKTRKSSVLRRVQETLSGIGQDLMAADTGSPEGVLSDLVDEPSRIWVRDELAGLLVSMRGVDYMKQARELLIELFDRGAPYKKRLSGKGNTYSTKETPALSFFGTIQPKVMGEVLFDGRNVDSGLVNRLLLVCATGDREYWPEVVDYQVIRSATAERLRLLYRQPAVTTMAKHLQDAASVWAGREVEEFGEYGEYVATRANVQALKLATLLQASKAWPKEGQEIDDKWLSVALKLLERWYRSATAVISEVHLKQPGERDRREFFGLACHATHNKRGAQGLGVLMAEAHVGKTQANRWLEDLVERQWVAVDDEMHVHCTQMSALCPKRGAA